MDLPPEILLKIFDFLSASTNSHPTAFVRLALVNRTWGSIANKYLYTSISHQGWKLRRVSACLETLALDSDVSSTIRSPDRLSLSTSISSPLDPTTAESDDTTLPAILRSHSLLDQHHDQDRRNASLSINPPPIGNSPTLSNMLAATVQHLHLRLWSPDSDNSLSQLLLHALSNTTNLATLNLSMSETFAQHFELHLLRKGIIALESPSEPQPTILARSFLPHLSTLDISPGFRLFQLTAGRPVRSVASSTHITDEALKHLVPFFQRSLGPVQKVHFNVTARDTNAVVDILRIIAWKLPCLTEVFFNLFVTKRGHPPKYSQDLLELLAPLSSLQTVEILLSRHARSPEPDPFLYQHFAALHALKATAPNVKHVVLDTIRWLYTSAVPSSLPPLPSTTESFHERHHHPEATSTPPPISPVSLTSVSHSPPSSNGPSTPPSTGIRISGAPNPTAAASSSRDMDRGQQHDGHETDNENALLPLPMTFNGNPSSPPSSYALSPSNSGSIVDIPTPKSTPSAYPPSPYYAAGTPASSFYPPLASDPHTPSSPTAKQYSPLYPPRTPLTPGSHFPQTPLSPGSFGSPDAGLDVLSPIYTGWSPLPSDPRTHMWWLGTYGNVVDARLAMCAMWGHILKDTENDMSAEMEHDGSDEFMKEAVDVLGVIPLLEDIGYMFGHDLASAGSGTTADMFAVGMHSNDPYPDETLGTYEIEEIA